MPFDDLARVLDVIVSDVIGGQGHPGSIWLIHAIGDAFRLSGIELGAAKNAVLGINAIVNAEIACRIFGQHHDTADAGRRDGL